VSGFRPDWAERIQRGRTKAFGKGYEQGYLAGSKEMKEYFAEQVIYAINQDGVLRTNAHVDTLERVVEIIEAVRDIGEAQS
jgi:hypothetical protein